MVQNHSIMEYTLKVDVQISYLMGFAASPCSARVSEWA